MGWEAPTTEQLLALLIVSAEREHRVMERDALVEALFALRRACWRPTRWLHHLAWCIGATEVADVLLPLLARL